MNMTTITDQCIYSAPWGIFHAFLSSADFFQINFFEKKILDYHQSIKLKWIQIRPGILLGLIWNQTFCKSYQQTTLGDKELTFF